MIAKINRGTVEIQIRTMTVIMNIILYQFWHRFLLFTRSAYTQIPCSLSRPTSCILMFIGLKTRHCQSNPIHLFESGSKVHKTWDRQTDRRTGRYRDSSKLFSGDSTLVIGELTYIPWRYNILWLALAKPHFQYFCKSIKNL